MPLKVSLAEPPLALPVARLAMTPALPETP
jgi:hypothetical protein